MTISHHPSDETLAAYAAGTLDEARSVVVAAHITLCPRCRSSIRMFEAVGGSLLDHAEPAPLSSSAIDAAMAQLDKSAESPNPVLPKARDYPDILAAHHVGDWRWMGRGLYWRQVDVASDDGTRVFMLKANPGIRLPHHRHSGTEWTCVLQGAFSHELGRFGPGDFDEADESVEHRPYVEDEGICICLVALQGGIELQGWIGRLLQPLVRI